MQRQFVIVTHAAFFLTGIVTTMLGPLLPELIQTWSLSDGQAGGLFLAQAAGALTGTVASSRLILRVGFERTLVLGAACMAGGVIGLTLPWVQATVVSIMAYGVGIGIGIPTTNLLVADRSKGRKAAALNVVNLAWCLGALTSPPIIAWCLVHGFIDGFLLALSGLIVLSLALFLRLDRSPKPIPPRATEHSDPHLTELPRVLIALVLFLYVSTEIGTAGWIPTYAQRLGLSEYSWSWLQSTFWGAFVLGRSLSPRVLKLVDPPMLVMGGLLAALIGEIAFLSAPAEALLFAGVALTGLGFATVYPTTIATFSEFYGSHTSARSMPIFVAASLGGAAGPWIIGYVSEQLQNLRWAMTLLIAALVVLLALQAVILRLWARKPALSATDH